MRICLIANGFTGTTIPLAENLHRLGHQVDIFYCLFQGIKTLDTLEFDEPIKCSLSTQQVSFSNSIYKYLSEDVLIKVQWVMREREMLNKTCLGYIQRRINRWILNRFCEDNIIGKYDVVNVVVYPRLMLDICHALTRYNSSYFITFHEVLDDLIKGVSLLPFIEKAVKFQVPIVVHSKKTLDDLVKYSRIDGIQKQCNLIHFGLFEGYLSYGSGKKCVEIKDYLLFIGHIQPYKGLNVLYDAVERLYDLDRIKVVVAGSGGYGDSVLNKMKKDSRFIVINRYIENSELAYLVQNCKAIVCPYLAASQSGVVQTAMVYGKPVIASKVGAFEEVIINGVNGYLVTSADVQGWAEALRQLYKLPPPKWQAIVPDSYNWDNICLAYQNMMEEILNNKSTPPNALIRWNRWLVFFVKRIKRRLQSYYHFVRLKLMGCKVGKHLIIHGHVGLTLSSKAMVSIGDNFYMSNGRHINPLCGNNEGHIHVEDNAKLVIGNNVAISSTKIWCAKSIRICDNVKIGGNVIIIDTDAHSINWLDRRNHTIDANHKKDLAVVIGNDAFIGMNTLILKGVEIGARSIIGAGSVVVKSIPPDCIAAGNPCKVIRQIQ